MHLIALLLLFQAPPDDLFKTISALDTELFDAYNKCDLEKFVSLLADDLEFYHDATGSSRGAQAAVDAVKTNICGKVRRDLAPGSLKVYPLKGYGAVETGIHLFCDPQCSSRESAPTEAASAGLPMLWQFATASGC